MVLSLAVLFPTEQLWLCETVILHSALFILLIAWEEAAYNLISIQNIILMPLDMQCMTETCRLEHHCYVQYIHGMRR